MRKDKNISAIVRIVLIDHAIVIVVLPVLPRLLESPPYVAVIITVDPELS